MMVNSTRIFHMLWYENVVSSMFFATLVGMVLQPVIVGKEWEPNILSVIFGVAGLVFLINYFVRQKVIVTSNEIIMTNVFGQKTIFFESIKTIQVMHFRYSHQLTIRTEQSEKQITVMRNTVSTEKLEEIKGFVLEQIRVHNSERFALINLRRYDVDAFWGK